VFNSETTVVNTFDNTFYLCFIRDRDWWLFRYILNFLRDGALPEDRSILAQLYREASFWHLGTLQRAIEEDRLHLKREVVKKDGGDKDKDKKEGDKKEDMSKMWWKKMPSWWSNVEDVKKEEDKKKAEKKLDWWTGTTYGGKTFLPLSTATDRVVTKDGEKDAIKAITNTWRVEAAPSSTYGGAYSGAYGGLYGGASGGAHSGAYGGGNGYLYNPSSHPYASSVGGGGAYVYSELSGSSSVGVGIGARSEGRS